MWLDGEESKAGQRVHELIAAALASGADGQPFDVVAATAASFRERPFGVGARYALKLRCSSAVGVYLQRCRPVGWSMVGTEVPLGPAVADVVWTNSDGVLVVDEVKTGAASPSDPRVADQLMRLADGAGERFGDRFAGVRLVPLPRPTSTAFLHRLDGQLVEAAPPVGMEVR